MTSSLEAAQKSALARIDHAQPLLLSVRIVGPPTVEATLTFAIRHTGLKLVPCALWSLEHGEVTPDSVAPPRIAGEIAGSSPIGVDEVTARYLERLTRTARGNQAGWSQEKK